MRKAMIAVIPLLLVLASCQTGVSMWGGCSPAQDGNTTGTDSAYVLVCKHGVWEPIMTVPEYLAIARGEKVTIALLPERPTPATTSTTTTSTTTTSTTTTLPPVDCTVEPAPNVNLSGCDLSNFALPPFMVDLSGANLTGTNLSSNHVHDLNMSNANLTGANLRNFAMHGGDLSGANLTNADFTEADLDMILTGAIWSNTTCPNGTVQSTPCDRFF